MKKHPLILCAGITSLLLSDCNPVKAPEAILPVPEAKQVEWQKMETYAFVHFGLNTFNDDDINNFFNINGSRNICTAVADKYSYSLHFSLTFLWMGCFLLSIFTECTHQQLLRSLIVQKCRNFIRGEIILTFLADDRKTDCLDQFGRFYVSWTALYACEAGEAFPDGLGVHQCFHIAVLYIGYKLMRTDVHLIVSRAGCRAFTASHTFSGIHAGDGTDFIGCYNFHACTSSLMPSASARSSVK